MIGRSTTTGSKWLMCIIVTTFICGCSKQSVIVPNSVDISMQETVSVPANSPDGYYNQQSVVGAVLHYNLK